MESATSAIEVSYSGKYRFMNLQNAVSASYIINNLTRSDSYLAYAKNNQGAAISKIVILSLKDLNNYSTSSDNVNTKEITWQANTKECTHVNYLQLNSIWYLIVGFTGGFEVYNEEGSKRYLNYPSSDFSTDAKRIESCSFICSCAATSCINNLHSLLIGTTLGEVYKFKVTKNNSFIHTNVFDLHKDLSLSPE